MSVGPRSTAQRRTSSEGARATPVTPTSAHADAVRAVYEEAIDGRARTNGAIPGAACAAGEATGITGDQFGNPRPGPDGTCDIGSFQTEGVAPSTPAVPVAITPTFTG